MRRLLVVTCLTACALVPSASAVSEYPMDAAGTRSLSLDGSIVAYRVSGESVTVAVRTDGSCTVLVWHTTSESVEATDRSCAALAATSRRASFAGVQVIASGRQAPDRLNVLVHDRVLRSWPLPVRVRLRSLQVAGGFAAFTARGGSGLWVARLSDGRVAFVAPIAAGDHPVLRATGLAYHDAVYKAAPADKPVLKFVTAKALGGALARVGRALHTGGPIRSFSVDGTRVALAVGGGGDQCDRVIFWNISWRSVAQVSQKSGPTCPTAAAGRISAVALGGARAQWLTMHRGRPMLVAADAINCQEWVIRRLSDLPADASVNAIAGDRSILTYAQGGGFGGQIGRLTGGYRVQNVFDFGHSVRQIAADGGRLAVLGSDGSIEVRTGSGVLLREFPPSGVTSVGLSGKLLAAATSNGRLNVYSLATGERVHAWRLPAGAGHVDLQYGIAVVGAGRAVYALDVFTGRTARVAVAPRTASAQIEPIGIVYSYSSKTQGTAKVVPVATLERMLQQPAARLGARNGRAAIPTG
jgi:hypothetical protein